MDHFTLKDGQLQCKEVPLEQIANEVGTPVCNYSAATLRRYARLPMTMIAAGGDSGGRACIGREAR